MCCNKLNPGFYVSNNILEQLTSDQFLTDTPQWDLSGGGEQALEVTSAAASKLPPKQARWGTGPIC